MVQLMVMDDCGCDGDAGGYGGGGDGRGGDGDGRGGDGDGRGGRGSDGDGRERGTQRERTPTPHGRQANCANAEAASAHCQ
eukprot:6047202-Alexandrium_andersonii.AAC.1